MTVRIKQLLVTLASGSALAIAPFTFATVVVPATGHADECSDSAGASTGSGQPCGTVQAQGMNCPDGTIVDDENKKCVNLTEGISKQLRALPAPPSLSGFGGGGDGGLGSLGSLPGGIPSLGTVNMPDLVLPSLGLGLVPNLNVSLQPQIGGISAPALAPLPAVQLPPPPAINPLNPLGLPPPPDLTPGIPFI